jgi:hypothetical protein
MDYSGMVDGLFEGNTLLNEVDGMVRNAIKCQVVSNSTFQHTVIHLSCMHWL